MRYLLKGNDGWRLVADDISDKFSKKQLVEIKPDELIIIFTKMAMQVFSYDKEMERLYLKSNEDNYNFAGKIFGKEDNDIFVYRRK